MRTGPNPKLILAFGALAFFVGVAAIYWQFTSYSKAKAKVASLETELHDEAELKELLATSGKQLVEFQDQLDHLEKGVPEFAYIPTLLTEIEAVGILNGIEVTGVRPVPQRPGRRGEKEEKKRDSAYTEVDIEINGRGDYDACMSFLEALQKFPKVVAVQQVNLTPKRDADDSASAIPRLDAKVLIRLYVFPPSEDEKGAWTSEPWTPADGTWSDEPTDDEAPADAQESNRSDMTAEITPQGSNS